MDSPVLTEKEKVDIWFHTLHIDDIAPCVTIKKVNDVFLDWLESHNLFVYDETDFRRSVCAALCTLKQNYRKFKICDIEMKRFPNRKYCNPGWKDEYDQLWDAYIETIYTTDIIDKLFEKVEIALWEEHLPNWRYIIGSILHFYIKPSIDKLENIGYLVLDEDEELKTYDDAFEEEFNEYYY
jgi:hypothetical protein